MKLIVKSALVLVLGAAGVFLVYRHSSAIDPMDDFTSWPPDAATIKKTLDTDPSLQGPQADKARHEEFAKLFQSRFRTHDPEMAIGLRVMGPDTLKLMCPARMEPWNLDKVAMSAWRQSRDVFGHSYNVDIYETYIGSPPRKIGELRPSKNNPEVQEISYSPARKASRPGEDTVSED